MTVGSVVTAAADGRETAACGVAKAPAYSGKVGAGGITAPDGGVYGVSSVILTSTYGAEVTSQRALCAIIMLTLGPVVG
jgi:hypothetical protein